MFKSQIGGLALNRQKWSEMGPEWSPGPENRSPGMPRPFCRLWDRSCSPKIMRASVISHVSARSEAWLTKSLFPAKDTTSSIGCANRSCEPPKLGRLLLKGVRWCRRRSAGGPSGADGAPESESPWGRCGIPYGSVHQSCTNTGQSSDPSDDYMLRAALEGTHFFLGENRHAPK